MENKNTLLLKNGEIADGNKRSVIKADILLKDGIIVEIGKDLDAKDCTVIDCTNKIIMSGFIDSHVHIESTMVLPKTFGEIVMPHGTTAVITDPHEIVNIAGTKGLDFYLNEAMKSPIDIFTSIPSSVPATILDTNGAGNFSAEDMRPYAERDDVVGLGEMMDFFAVAGKEKSYMDKIELFKNKTIDGHTAGIPKSLIKDYALAGVQNDHECTDAKMVLEEYNCGMNIYIREGSAAHNADVILNCIREHNLDLSQFAFCTDDCNVATVNKFGHISKHVKLARKHGFTWGEIACMASYNPSRYYHLENRGNIQERFIADIAIVDKDTVSIDYVIKNGVLVAENMKLIHNPSMDEVNNKYLQSSVHFSDLCREDFRMSEGIKKVAIELVDNQLLTNKVELSPEDSSDLSLLFVIGRHGKNNNRSVCLLKGYNIKGGAVATSVSHDSHNVICTGDNVDDMILACERLKEIGGGYVIASDNKISTELSLPIFGVMSPESAEKVSKKMSNLHKVASSLNINQNIDPFTTLSFVALPVIPSIRLLDTGLYDVECGEFIK